MRSAVVGVTVFAISLARSLAGGFGLTDEGWFLQIVNRLRSGDVLYRDVYVGVMPLSVYVTTALSWLTGVEILAVKIVTNAAFALTVVVADRLVRRAGATSAWAWALVGALLILGRPYANPPYTPLSMTLFMATLAITLDLVGWGSPACPSRRNAAVEYWLTGVCAGLSFMAKQNVGLLALAAALVGVLLAATDRRRALLHDGLVVTGFASAALLTLVPVILGGGLPGLWDYTLAGKGSYVRLGGVAYTESLSRLIGQARRLPAPAAVMELAHGLVLIIPISVALAGAWRWRRIDSANRVLVVFAAAAVATAFPRWDRFHMAYAVPVLLLTLVALFGRAPLSGGLARSAGRSSWLAAAALFGLAAVDPVMAIVGTDAMHSSRLPHFRGPMIAADTERRLAASTRAMIDAAEGPSMFVLGTDAGFWYLATGLRNPTPFDIPAKTSVGRTGTESLLGRLSSGRLTPVCVANQRELLGLTEVEAFIQRQMRKGPDVGPCTVYRSRSQNGESP